MRANIYTEDIDIYAEESNKRIPAQANYTAGVKVNWTAPAKWWNYFMNFFTHAIMNHKQDNAGIRDEITSVIAEANLRPIDGTVRQLSDSLNYIAYQHVKENDAEPYVINHKLILPINELLP